MVDHAGHAKTLPEDGVADRRWKCDSVTGALKARAIDKALMAFCSEAVGGIAAQITTDFLSIWDRIAGFCANLKTFPTISEPMISRYPLTLSLPHCPDDRF
ncbi:MAG: hypothetical protein RJQ21_07160 [Rhodospirillales bacterium]